MQRFFRFSLTALLLGFVPAVHAEDSITVGAGWFDINRSDDSSANFSGEWRGNPFYYGFRPVVGASVNTDGGAYGYGGVVYDWEFAPHWAVVPGVDVGIYGHGHSIDLGGPLEFHESFEVDYKFDNDYRVGAQISHTSNADIYSNNPGVDTLMATFTFPL